MTTTKAVTASLSLVVLLLGAFLVLVVPDEELLWFRGRPLGVVLVVLSLLDLLDLGTRRRRAR